MAYRIQYGKASKKEKDALLRNSKKLHIFKWGLIAVVVLLISIFGRFGYLDFLIPGDRDLTKSAFQAMVEDVREGECVKRAITAFCEVIIAGAEYKG